MAKEMNNASSNLKSRQELVSIDHVFGNGRCHNRLRMSLYGKRLYKSLDECFVFHTY